MINQGGNLFSIELVIILDPEGSNVEKYISINGPKDLFEMKLKKFLLF